MIEYGGVHKIKKQDWIILRLLFLNLTLDPTMVNVDEIQLTMDYLRKRYQHLDQDIILHAFPALSYEHGQRKTFMDKYKDVQSFRLFSKSVEIHWNYPDEEARENAQRRTFGVQDYTIKPGNPNGY